MFTARPKLLLVIALLLLFVMPLNGHAQNEPIVKVILFYSPTCPHCREVLSDVLPVLQARYGTQLEVRLYDLTTQSGYQVFMALLEQNPNLPTSVPQLYIDQSILVGSDQIRDNLPSLIEACLARGGCDWSFTIGVMHDTAPTGTSHPVYLAYCYDPTCLECDRVTYDIDNLQRQYPNLIVQRFNIHEDAALIEAMCERYGVPDEQRLLAPAVFVGGSYLMADDLSPTQLRSTVEQAGTIGSQPPWAGLDSAALETAAAAITARFSGFSVLAVAAAGLLDGVNPCAFTTIIFFISYLALVGRDKRDILIVGALFTLAVFLSYTALGMGLAAVIERLGSVTAIGRLLYLSTAVVCGVLAVMSLWDYRKIRQGKLNEIALQLPKSMKRRIHHTIRTHSRMRGYAAAAFGAGVLVSVFELACTGQVYLPTIVFMTSVAEMRTTALAYLVLYNVLFVVPLMVVFAVTYFGIKSERLTAVFQTHAGAVKLVTAALFGVLCVWLAVLLL
jgi:hypothetical protein